MARWKTPRGGEARRRSRPRIEGLERRSLLSVGVTTYRYDNTGGGLNPNETTLAPNVVNAADFGKLFSSGIDGYAYAEPLYVPGVNITAGSNRGTHNVLYVATEHDSLYAFDADNGVLLWKDSLLHPIHGGVVTPVPTVALGFSTLGPEEGITSTPVIDAATGTLYALTETKEVVGGVDHYIQQLHAIDLGGGGEKFGGPATVADTIFDGTNYTVVSGPTVAGNGSSSVGGQITYNALRQTQRAALAENNGTIYIAAATQSAIIPYHGWLLGYDAHTLSLTAAFNTTPNANGGSIWAGGGGLSFDAQGNIYLAVANGIFDGNNGSDPNADAGGPGPITGLNAQGFPALGDYGDSLVKLAPDPTSSPAHPNINGWGLKVVDYFTPNQQAYLNNKDLDLGSQQVLLLPASAGSAAHPNLVEIAGKEGTVYLLDQNNLGKFGTTTDNVVQELHGAFANGSVTSPAVFGGSFYYAPNGGHLEQFAVANGAFTAITAQESPDTFTYPGSPPSISSNGTTNGIIWAIDHLGSQLRAYDATNLSNVLYTSSQAIDRRDALLGMATTFSAPTVINGKVYVATQSGLTAYGVLPTSPLLPLTIGPAPFGSHNPDLATAEVNGLYNILLGRAPDPGGLANAVAYLKGGGSLQTLSTILMHTNEYYGDVVASYYRTFVGRDGSPAEVAAWVGVLRGGTTLEGLAYLMLTSAGFNGLHPDDGSFLQALYQDILGRSASAGEIAAWESAIVKGLSRASVVSDFIHSPASAKRAVDGFALAFWGRPIDAATEQFTVAYLVNGGTLVEVASAFAASAPFVQRAQAMVG